MLSMPFSAEVYHIKKKHGLTLYKLILFLNVINFNVTKTEI